MVNCWSAPINLLIQHACRAFSYKIDCCKLSCSLFEPCPAQSKNDLEQHSGIFRNTEIAFGSSQNTGAAGEIFMLKIYIFCMLVPVSS